MQTNITSNQKLWSWIIDVLKEEKKKQKYSSSMFPQISSEINKSIDALNDVIESCEFRAQQDSKINIPLPK
jgi:hypothetical protein